ncbi:MAG TPA: DUF6496 domain-containing protein [Casimicrobiaceae bacterium]
MAKYGKKAQAKVRKVMHERKEGKLESGGSHKKVRSRKQAIAIGLSEARRAGAKVPPNPNRSSKKSAAKKSPAKKSASKKSAPKKSATKKSAARKASKKRAAKKSSKNKSSAKKGSRQS